MAEQKDGRGGSTLRVWGSIKGPAGVDLPAGLKVRAYDIDMRTETLLDEGDLDPSGRFELRYSRESFAAADAGTADILVRVVDVAGHTIGESELFVNAPDDLEVNLEIDPARLLTEWERYLALLDVVRQGVPLADLTDTNIQFLAKELGLPVDRLTMIRTAARNAPDLLVSPELIYAFERLDMGGTAVDLGARDHDQLRAAAARAVEQRIVPPIDPAMLARLLKRLGQLHADREPLSRVLEGAGVDGVETLVKRFASKGVRSLGDLKSRQGLALFADAQRETPGPALELIRSHVNLSVLVPDLQVRNALLNHGYRGVDGVASDGLAEFLDRTRKTIDPFVATTLHTQAGLLQQFIKKTLIEVRLDLTRGGNAVDEAHTGILINAVQAAQTKCECTDCESAVSPLAYLADLLKYCHDNVRDGTQRVDYVRLGRELHQKFGDLPTECGAIEEEVRQVRIAVEVLRAHLAAHPPSALDAGRLQTAERDYLRAAYEQLLLRIGTSYADLRLAVVASAEEQAELADRIGIRGPAGTVNHLRDLLLDVSGAATATLEDTIERLFGLKDTRKDPLASPPVPNLLAWRRERLRDIWLGQDWPDDTPGPGVSLVDPDIIGPDDVRYADPAQTTGAFEIWRRRRSWIDQQLASLLTLTPAAQASRLDVMVDAMFVQTGGGALPAYALNGGATAPARRWPDTKTALLAIGDVLATGTKAAVAAAISTLASSYGLSVEAFQRLVMLREKDLASLPAGSVNVAPTAAEVREFASILAQSRKRLHAADWAAEEQALEFGPGNFWISLTEPEVGDWPPVDDGRSPWIDPDLVKLLALPDSSVGAAARQLWITRWQALQDYKSNQIKPARSAQFDGALATAFGVLPASLSTGVTTWGGYVEDVLQKLGSSVPADVTAAKARLDQLFLTEEPFRRLMVIRAKDASADQTVKPTAAEYEEADLILLGAYKRKTLYPTWRGDERTQATPLADWQALKVRLAPWRGTPEDRTAWQAALRERSQPALVDPDLTARAYLKTDPAAVPANPTVAADVAAQLWQARQTALAARVAAIRTARTGAAAAADQGFSAALAAAGTPTLLTRSDLSDLRAQLIAGAGIAKRLIQLGLDIEAFQYLSRIDELVSALPAQTVDGPEWEEVYSILTEVWKRRRVLGWRQAERAAGITLGPDCFTIPAVDWNQFPPPLPPDPPRWRATTDRRQTWEDRLQARIDQDREVARALARLVSAVEEATLPPLRDALVAAVPLASLPGGGSALTLSQKPKVLSNQLMIDLQMNGCANTTRVAQAIETIQNLLFSLRGGLLLAYPTWTLTAGARASFDAVWMWIGSYATWRAAMFVLLYPENLLVPSLRRERTPAFNKVLAALRARGTLAAGDAAGVTTHFVSYLRDVAELAITPSPLVESHFVDEGQPPPLSVSPSRTVPVRFLFGLAPSSDQIYWSIVFRAQQGERQSPWRLLAQFKNDVTSVLGSVVYRTPGGRRFLYLFARSSRDGEDHLGFARFDLDAEGRWSPAEAEEVDLAGETHVRNIELLGTAEDVPPAVRVTTSRSTIIDIQLGVKGVTSGITTATAGSPASWSAVYQPPALVSLIGGQYSVPGGFALRRGSLGTRYDLVLLVLSVRLTNQTYWGEFKVIRGIDANGGPPANQGSWAPVGERRTGSLNHLPDVQWAFGDDSAGNRPVSCAIAVADIDGDQKEDLIIVTMGEGSNAAPPIMYCRLGLGLNDDSTADTWINSSVPMFASVPSNPGPCSVAVLRRGAVTFDLLVAGAGGANGRTIWLKKITLRLQNGVLSFSDPKDGPTFTAANTVGGLGIAIADLDGDGVNDVLVQWTEQNAAGQQTASKLRYGPRIDANGFPTQAWSTPIDVDSTLYQGGGATFPPGASGLAVGGLTGAPGRLDALIATFPQVGPARTVRSTEWRYFVANSINLRLSTSTAQVLPLGQYKPFLISPLVPASYDYRIGADRTYAPSVTQVWNRNAGKTRINQTLVAEAFFFVPLAIALQLQRSGDYLAALDWFRSIYDYSLPRASRVIYPGLEPNPGGSGVWRDANWQWLQDPLDPHGIAEGRNGTYKLFVLQSIIRCLLEYADAEFTQDTSESITLARTLYLEALELMEDDDLKQTYNGCDQIREWITFVIGELEPSLSQPAKQDLYDAFRLGNRHVLTEVAKTLSAARTRGAMTVEAEAQIHSTVSTAAMAPAAPRTVAGAFTEQAAIDAHLTQAFASDAQYAPELLTLTMGTSESLDRLFTGTFGSSYQSGMFDVQFPNDQLSDEVRELIPGGGYSDPPQTNVRDLFQTLLDTLGNRVFHEGPPGRGGRGGVYGGREFPPLTPYEGPALLSIDACVPPNPVLRSLRLRAELNLYKIRTCRSITGERRQVDPYSAATDTSTGMPSIGSGGQLVVPGIANLAPTPYRFSVLIERAKTLVQLAQQTENAMLAAIQSGDNERYNALHARQDLDNARANVKLQTLRISEAQSTITLTQLQRDRAQIEVDQYDEWLQAGLSGFEEVVVGAMWVAFALNTGATAIYAAKAIAMASTGVGAAEVPNLLASAAGSAAQASSQVAQIYQFWAAYDEKQRNWRFQRNIAQQDRKIADQQYFISQDQLRVVTQEQTIASLNETHASATIEFLAQKFTSTDLYDWMADVLQGVYRYFLQQAAGTARLAASQLAFERQEAPPPFIQADYWTPPSDGGSASADGKAPDRRGLTGSARLLQDVTQLDQYAFTTDRRKLQLSKTMSIAQLAPLEFQRFRETGVLSFATPMELFDRDFPGHYLRLVRRVRVSILALTPPSLGVKATLTANRVSRVVIGGDLFQTVRVSHGPDIVALSSPRDTAGMFDLDIQPNMLAPFENIGVSTTWELRMPRAANPFDFTTIADVFFTIEYTALHSFDYQQQVVPRLGRRVTARRAWSFRNQFADQWYELNNPDVSTTPMRVRFETVGQDFPPNVEPDSLSADDIVLHFVPKDGRRFEISPVALRLKEQGATAFVGGSANTIDGTINTATGSAGSWMTMQTKRPIGQWELALPNTEEMRGRFQSGDILDVMLIVTYSGRLPEWPK